MAIRDILLLGNPRLHQRWEPLPEGELPEAQSVGRDLHDTMMDFRQRHLLRKGSFANQLGD